MQTFSLRNHPLEVFQAPISGVYIYARARALILPSIIDNEKKFIYIYIYTFFIGVPARESFRTECLAYGKLEITEDHANDRANLNF